MNWLGDPKELPRLMISLAILGAFLGAVIYHYSVGLEETLKAMAMIVVGYWLGTSRGSTDKARQIEQLADRSADAAERRP
ncbi:MAG: hypothetical protein QOI38_3116 [Sphingomonadales bacterium]|jgi:hypothetical protein|nr:hypothetical protein [Sphingomonadales bacterium]